MPRADRCLARLRIRRRSELPRITATVKAAAASREADRDLAENPDAPTYSMSEVIAAIFEEEPGKGAA